jgi:translation initiation factor 4E
MAAVESQAPTNGESGQVDLSTIPISPTGASSETKKPDADSEQITVFHDKDNFNVKHPLMNKWTLWFTKPPSGKVIATLSLSLGNC